MSILDQLSVQLMSQDMVWPMDISPSTMSLSLENPSFMSFGVGAYIRGSCCDGLRLTFSYTDPGINP